MAGDPRGFVSLAMVELSAEKFEVLKDDEWEKRWAQFWQQRLCAWNQLISGKLADEMGKLDLEGRAAAGSRMQSLAALLFGGTQGNWLALFEFARENDPRLCTSLLLDVVPFLQLTGQRLLAPELATRAVAALRAGWGASSRPWKRSSMVGPAATKPCTVYAQLLRTLCFSSA